MGKSFAKIAFTPLVKQQQTLHGSRTAYDRVAESGPPGDRLTEAERYFLAANAAVQHFDGDARKARAEQGLQALRIGGAGR